MHYIEFKSAAAFLLLLVFPLKVLSLDDSEFLHLENVTDPDIRLMLTPPSGAHAQTLSIDIPATPVKVETSSGTAISLGRDLIYVPGKGLIPLEPNSEDAAKVRLATETHMRDRGIPMNDKPLCVVVVEEKHLPRRFFRAQRVKPRAVHSVDVNITVMPQEIAVSF